MAHGEASSSGTDDVPLMRCIFCLQDRPGSDEHIFPLAIGGRLKTNRVCTKCNSDLGARVDAALSDFFPIRMRRSDLGLAGNGGIIPAWYEMFVGKATVVGQKASRVSVTFNKSDGKLDTRQLYHAEDTVTAEGNRARLITVDARDRDQIPKMIQRERKRHGLRPLTDEELTDATAGFTETLVDRPIIKRDFSVSFAYLRHAIIKIAYELAFLWLGEDYLDDPLAAEIRAAITKEDVASTDDILGYVGVAEQCTAFNAWTPHDAHHLAYASLLSMDIIVAVRIFDIYAAAVVVSRQASRYFKTQADQEKLRFLAIDASTGATVDTAFQSEVFRLARLMSFHCRRPPFPDPL
jgi:hypothetical protein